MISTSKFNWSQIFLFVFFLDKRKYFLSLRRFLLSHKDILNRIIQLCIFEMHLILHENIQHNFFLVYYQMVFGWNSRCFLLSLSRISLKSIRLIGRRFDTYEYLITLKSGHFTRNERQIINQVEEKINFLMKMFQVWDLIDVWRK